VMHPAKPYHQSQGELLRNRHFVNVFLDVRIPAKSITIPG